MKFFVVAAALFVAVSARNIKIADVRDCGEADAAIRFSGAVKTDPVPVPGNMTMDLAFSSSIDSNDKLMFHKTTTRLSDGYQVPCVNGFHGSCVLNFCQAITQFPDLFCPLLPSEIPCQCPLLAGDYSKVDALVEFDELWLDIEGGATGDYTSRMEFKETGLVLGCVDVDFSLLGPSGNFTSGF